MVDVFVGDRVHCSFNTSRQCANHATSALHTATMLLQDSKPSQVNIGVATGKVLRGDMGCEVMRRFSMVGTLVRDVHGMERAERILGCDVLCNRMCFSEAECEHEMRLIPCKVEVSATSDTPEVVAELLPDTAPSMDTSIEWMYQIGKSKKWENYNTTVRKYLKGDVSAAAVEEAPPNSGRTPVDSGGPHFFSQSFLDRFFPGKKTSTLLTIKQNLRVS